MASFARRQLVDFLIEKVYEPVMSARAYGRSPQDKQRLLDIQEATRAKIDALRATATAEAVVREVRRELAAPGAAGLQADLLALKLPSLAGVKDEFERKVRALGVEA